MVKLIINPYKKVNFAATNRYKANYHFHTMQNKIENDGKIIYGHGRTIAPDGTEIQPADPSLINDRGEWSPRFEYHEDYLNSDGVVWGSDGRVGLDEYIKIHAEYGYDILAVGDHNRCMYPWSRWLKQPPIAFEGTSAELYNINGRDILSVASNELSGGEHRVSMFAKYENNSSNIELTQKELENLYGFLFFAHPSMYENTPDYYIDMIKKWGFILGQEVVNRGASSGHEELWDSILVESMPLMPVWGFANTDNHFSLAGDSFNMMFMDELSPWALRKSLCNGEFYFVKDSSDKSRHNPDMAPAITNIEVEQETGKITLSAINCSAIEWVYDGQVVGQGGTYELNEVNYIRARVIGDTGGVAYTQPFGLLTESDINIENILKKRKVIKKVYCM